MKKYSPRRQIDHSLHDCHYSLTLLRFIEDMSTVTKALPKPFKQSNSSQVMAAGQATFYCLSISPSLSLTLSLSLSLIQSLPMCRVCVSVYLCGHNELAGGCRASWQMCACFCPSSINLCNIYQSYPHTYLWLNEGLNRR